MSFFAARSLIAAVWLLNGLFCKVLNLAPRHHQIVAEILTPQAAPILTPLIGLAEMLLALWILSDLYPRFSGWLQIILVLTMNLLEQFLTPQLLLWGRWNFLWAVLLCLFIWSIQLRPLRQK